MFLVVLPDVSIRPRAACFEYGAARVVPYCTIGTRAERQTVQRTAALGKEFHWLPIRARISTTNCASLLIEH